MSRRKSKRDKQRGYSSVKRKKSDKECRSNFYINKHIDNVVLFNQQQSIYQSTIFSLYLPQSLTKQNIMNKYKAKVFSIHTPLYFLSFPKKGYCKS